MTIDQLHAISDKLCELDDLLKAKWPAPRPLIVEEGRSEPPPVEPSFKPVPGYVRLSAAPQERAA